MTVRTTVSCAFLFATLIVAIGLGTTLWGGSGASAGTQQTLTICKVTSPASTTAFTFHWSAGSLGPQTPFQLTGGQCNTVPFNYATFTETPVPSGWTLTNISCPHTAATVHIYPASNPSQPNTTFDPGDDTVTIDSAQPNVTCTFTNTCPPVISCGPSPTPTCLPGTACTPTPSPSPTPAPTRTEAPTPTPTKAPTPTPCVPGASGNCTPTPTPPPPCSITINKQTDPAGGKGFAFSSAWSGLQGITLDDGQSITVPVPCGPISNVYETPMPGWILTNIACVLTGGGNFSIIGANPNPAFQPGDTEVTFDSLTPGANLSCTFTNVQRATPPPTCSITINKKTNPAGGTGFAFSSAFAGLQGITLNGGQSITKKVPCDQIFNVYETPKPGWTLTSIVCGFTSGAGNFSIVGANANPAFQPGDNEVDFNSLTPGANVSCTFINTQTDGACSITIDKKASPAGGTGFGFSSAWAGLQGITLDDGQSITKPVGCGPNSGIYNLFEAPKPGWTLTNIACAITGGTGNFKIVGFNANPAFQAGDNEVDFDSLSTGANITCTFVNTQTDAPCSITITKHTDPAGGTGFGFISAMWGLQSLTLDDGQSIYSSGLGGCDLNSSVFETPTPGWVLTNIACVITGGTGNFKIVGFNANPAFQPGDNEVDFDSLSPGANLSCTFTNERSKEPGTITICKNTDPAGGTGFTFGWSAPLIRTRAFPLDGGHCVTFPALLPGDGPYSFWELSPLPPGWMLTNIVCTGGANVLIGSNSVFDPGDAGVTIDLGPGENVTCTFTNTQREQPPVCTPDTPGYTVIKDIGTGQGGAPAAVDPNWVGIFPAGPLYSAVPWIPFWSPAPAGTNWINWWPEPLGAVDYSPETDTFDTSFYVDTNNYYGFELNFKWAADDNVNIVLNSSTVASGGSWSLIGPAIVNTFTPLIANATNYLKAALDNTWWSPSGLLVVGQLTACRKPPIKPACITIVKDALPDDPQDFNFTWNASPFVLDDDATLQNPSATPNSKTLCDLSPGATHTITETTPLPPGWILANITCSQSPPGWATVVIGPNPPAAFNPGDNTVQITLPALLPSGGHVTCIFSDRKIDKPGCITIIKDRKPKSPEGYLFQGAPWPGLFTLDDDPSSATPNSDSLCDLQANGAYTISELGAVPPPPPQQQVSPTAVVNIVCTVTPATFATVVFLPSGSTTYQPGDNGVKITVGPQTANGNVTCTFVNAPIFPSLLGDFNCNGTVDVMDMLKGLKYLAGLNMPMDPTSERACPMIGDTVLDVADEQMLWGDWNCNGMVGTMDTLGELQALAGLPYTTGEFSSAEVQGRQLR